MDYKIEEFNEIHTILRDFKIEENKFYFLPEDMLDLKKNTNLIYSETTANIQKVFKSNHLNIDYLTEDIPQLRLRRSSDWFGPCFFIGISLLSENSHLIGVSLNLISDYLYDLFKGTTKDKKVKFDIIIEKEKNKQYSKITYDGTVDGIRELEKIINKIK